MPSSPRGPLRVRWLGSVRYRDAHALQRALWAYGDGDWLLMLEHPHVLTLGVRARPEHVLVDPGIYGADLEKADRGGDVTYHGPGQLVGYPILGVERGSSAVPRHVWRLEQAMIDSLAELGVGQAGRLEGYPGVWLDPNGPRARKVAAVGVRVSKGRSMHGFALNVEPDLKWFSRIVPCGIADKAVTSLREEGCTASMAQVVEAVSRHFARVFGYGSVERADVAQALPGARVEPLSTADPTGPWRPVELRPLGRRLAQAGVDPAGGLSMSERKPPWLRNKAVLGSDYRAIRSLVAELSLNTVCQEAGCPNIYECWADGTATFMVNGERCTRACGFCQVETAKPLPVDPEEPERVAEAVARLGLRYAVVTTVARDDLPDGGAATLAATVRAIRERVPGVAVELLISDCKGDPKALEQIFDSRPEVLNHNVETVPRLQRAVRPSASYARSLAVLARARQAGLVTKSGLIVGMGEAPEEVRSTLADLAGVGVSIVTVGQYLRPSARHIPVARFWTPEEFEQLRRFGEGLGLAHVEASPLTRSSYHARQAASAHPTGVRP